MARRRRRRRQRTQSTRLPLPLTPLAFAVLTLILFSLFLKMITSPTTAWTTSNDRWIAFVAAVACAGLAVDEITQHVHRRRRLTLASAYWTWLDQLDQQVATGSMTPGEFEVLIARLLIRDGHMQVQVVGGRGDLGADVISVDPRGRRVVVQCKRYLGGRSVTSGDVQRFLGTVWAEHRADIGMFVTTSRFTTDALALGHRRGLYMVDRATLAGWMARLMTSSALPAIGP